MAEEKHEKKEKKPKQQQQQGGDKKASRKPKGAAPAAEEAADAPKQPAPPARLQVRYKDEIAPRLRDRLGLKNLLAVPRLEKVVISMGVGKIATAGGADAKSKIDTAEKELGVIAGQKPVRCKAKKSVANFKVREGMETGIKVTLRGARMYEFVDRLIALAIPRVKDFRGLDPKGFDGRGNFNFGLTEQTVFPEVNIADVTFQQGMNITIVTTARNAQHGHELLKEFGMPFRVEGKESMER